MYSKCIDNAIVSRSLFLSVCLSLSVYVCVRLLLTKIHWKCSARREIQDFIWLNYSAWGWQFLNWHYIHLCLPCCFNCWIILEVSFIISTLYWFLSYLNFLFLISLFIYFTKVFVPKWIKCGVFLAYLENCWAAHWRTHIQTHTFRYIYRHIYIHTHM